jgi:hypothetical protein
VLPTCKSEAMQLHLERDRKQRSTTGAHSIILLDTWHQNAEGPQQHLADATAAARTRTQRPGNYLAAMRQKLALQTASSNPSATSSSITAAAPAAR